MKSIYYSSKSLSKNRCKRASLNQVRSKIFRLLLSVAGLRELSPGKREIAVACLGSVFYYVGSLLRIKIMIVVMPMSI